MSTEFRPLHTERTFGEMAADTAAPIFFDVAHTLDRTGHGIGIQPGEAPGVVYEIYAYGMNRYDNSASAKISRFDSNNPQINDEYRYLVDRRYFSKLEKKCAGEDGWSLLTDTDIIPEGYCNAIRDFAQKIEADRELAKLEQQKAPTRPITLRKRIGRAATNLFRH